MAPLGVVTPGFQLAVCSDVRLIIISKFSSSRAQVVSRAGGLVYNWTTDRVKSFFD